MLKNILLVVGFYLLAFVPAYADPDVFERQYVYFSATYPAAKLSINISEKLGLAEATVFDFTSKGTVGECAKNMYCIVLPKLLSLHIPRVDTFAHVNVWEVDGYEYSKLAEFQVMNASVEYLFKQQAPDGTSLFIRYSKERGVRSIVQELYQPCLGEVDGLSPLDCIAVFISEGEGLYQQ